MSSADRNTGCRDARPSTARRGGQRLCLAWWTALVLAGGAFAADQDAAIRWQHLEPGLDFAEIALPRAASIGDSKVRVVRADPSRFGLRLLSVSAEANARARSARAWADASDVVAVTNASMYQKDGRTSVSLMRSPGHVNNPRLSKDRTVLAFDPVSAGVPAIQIIDRTCQDFEGLRQGYGSLVQSIRMISCQRRNVWAQQPRAWSTAAIATDERGAVLFLHVRSPYTMHDLIDQLLSLPLKLVRMMYLEGGAPAQLFVRGGSLKLEVVGSKGSSGIGGNIQALPIPNALALYRRAGAAR